VTWTGGGEPTLHPDFDEDVRYADTLCLRQGLYTHGGHINEARGKLLSNTLDWIVVSVDCADAESYAAYKGVSQKLVRKDASRHRRVKAWRKVCALSACRFCWDATTGTNGVG